MYAPKYLDPEKTGIFNYISAPLKINASTERIHIHYNPFYVYRQESSF